MKMEKVCIMREYKFNIDKVKIITILSLFRDTVKFSLLLTKIKFYQPIFIFQSDFDQSWFLQLFPLWQAELQTMFSRRHEHFFVKQPDLQQHFLNPWPVPTDKVRTISRILAFFSRGTSFAFKPRKEVASKLFLSNQLQITPPLVPTLYLPFTASFSRITPTRFAGSPLPLSNSGIATETQSPTTTSGSFFFDWFSIFCACFSIFMLAIWRKSKAGWASWGKSDVAGTLKIAN